MTLPALLLPPALKMLPAGYDRQKYLGGSDAAAIFGVSPWRTPYDLWVDKTTPRVFNEDGSPYEPNIDPDRAKFFARRKRQEPVIAEMLADEYGIVVTRLSLDEDPNRYIDPEFPFLAAEIDFEFSMSDAVRAAFPDREDFGAIANGTELNGEIKTVHPFKASEWGEQGSEEVPIHYAAQVMHGLGVTRKPAALVAALFGLDILLCFPVMADQETIAAMREKEVHFWTYNVQQHIPPEPLNVDDIKRMYAKFSGKPVELSQEAYEALIAIDTLRGRVKQANQDMEEAEWRVARCVAFNWGLPLINPDKPEIPSQDNAVLMYEGRQAGSWNRQRGTYLDQRRLAREQPAIVSAFTVEHFYRAFRLKKEKRK
jgi:putative phage-type endonuclease